LKTDLFQRKRINNSYKEGLCFLGFIWVNAEFISRNFGKEILKITGVAIHKLLTKY
jgi:hypothetical protein